MNKYLLPIVLAAMLLCCKSKKVSLAENDENVDAHDFIEFFQPLKLPYQVTDTLLHRKEAEGSAINYKLFTRFIPDSVLTRYFGKESKPRLYASGKVRVPENETYLFVRAATPTRKGLYILCFDKKAKFAAARLILYSDNDPGVHGQADMDAKYTLSVMHQRKGPDGQQLYTKDAYVYNGEVGFQLILTESNEGKPKPVAVYDPIDTLAHKHKFSGDYALDKRNFIAVRDGRDASRFIFFVHFEKDDGQCKGELKGEAKFVSPNIARYKANGDPCALEFSFSSSAISMKELDGCGNHRDIKCFFEGYYPKQKEAKPKAVKKK